MKTLPTIVVLLTFVGLSLPACSESDDASLQQKPVAATTPEQGEEMPPIAGGMSATDTQDAEVVKAAEFAASQMGQALDSVLEASQQVVAGMNYAMTIKLKNGDVYEVLVYRDLQGNYSMTEYRKQ
ncbi:MAG: hypothetical protein KJ914_15975 [Gammaproteobacteria bacterium]|nr:hypothetical protein [Gammaproteobacteria bacterium]MBU1725274.1 hypothetical protein [Gammaproteobacteria bacterium]MBU2006778.1 hypothetical protein [Gammaproteobacteria bacterium]